MLTPVNDKEIWTSINLNINNRLQAVLTVHNQKHPSSPLKISDFEIYSFESLLEVWGKAIIDYEIKDFSIKNHKSKTTVKTELTIGWISERFLAD